MIAGLSIAAVIHYYVPRRDGGHCRRVIARGGSLFSPLAVAGSAGRDGSRQSHARIAPSPKAGAIRIVNVSMTGRMSHVFAFGKGLGEC